MFKLHGTLFKGLLRKLSACEMAAFKNVSFN